MEGEGDWEIGLYVEEERRGNVTRQKYEGGIL